MSATADAAEGQRKSATRLGLQTGQIVQEIGWDEDCDEDLRVAVEDATGTELVADDVEDVVDVVLLWWRDGDGDLVDALVDALTSLASAGVIWVLTPKSGRPGHVEPSEIGEAAPTAGLSATSSVAGPGLVRESVGRPEIFPTLTQLGGQRKLEAGKTGQPSQ